MSWLTNTIVVPRARTSSSDAMHFSWKATSPTASTSSTSSTSASAWSIIENARRTCMPIE